MHDERKQALIDSDRRHLVRAAARLLGPTDAEDVVQDAYVRALESAGSELNAAQAWLLTVVRNLAIDRLRRRQWMQQWLQATAGDADMTSPSAESEAAWAQEAARALRLLAKLVTPVDGATVLLHEVFDVDHNAIAQACGRTEAGSRQQLRRALQRLRQAAERSGLQPSTELDPPEETVFRLFLQSLQRRDPQVLWAMLRQPAIRAEAGAAPLISAAAAAPETKAGVVQVGGQLGLVLTLDGVTLCVLPLGVWSGGEFEVALG